MADDLVIAVTGPSQGHKWAWRAISWRLRRLGVTAIYLTAQSGYPGKHIDGFIISGGNDIDPAIYGGDVSQSPSVDPSRDSYELSVIAEARRRDLPVLGICRGMQLLNVQAGGTLISDLKPYRRLTSNRGTLLPRKRIEVQEHSVLHRWLGKLNSRVNSLHHQAVAELGDGFTVSSRDRDGIIQSIENDRNALRVGVQWHPEYLPQRREHRRLFDCFVRACRANRQAQHAGKDMLEPEPISQQAAA
ncbi:MAG: gamma-glutamyl-gamma-aminobutyrate hydrolase family protein [Gammaproteobacteria bacterium]|nr:gamma-glutamyl-gamma-aminobutyrate hydrolase family protein [Gammaproteobacteria bacterium]